MIIRPAVEADLDAWAALKAALWPDGSIEEHREEAVEALAEPEGLVAYVAQADDGTIAGFVEASVRHDYVNGCETSPVAFVEGLYVRPEHRNSQIARTLVATVAAWGRAQGCSELASDAEVDNVESHAFHQAIGFEETERVVYFRMGL